MFCLRIKRHADRCQQLRSDACSRAARIVEIGQQDDKLVAAKTRHGIGAAAPDRFTPSLIIAGSESNQRSPSVSRKACKTFAGANWA